MASNLRRLRQERGYSLETLGRHSGVSRAMLGQIETGKSAPTITLLWKIARALGVDIGQLITKAEPIPPVVLRSSQLRASSAGSDYEVRYYASPAQPSSYEASELRIAPQHTERFEPQGPALHATLIVTDGRLRVSVGDAPPTDLSAGDAILFNASIAHSFSNPGTDTTVAYLIVGLARHAGMRS